MVDLKKLITGFLLLAVLMSSVLFIFSSFRSEKTEVSDLAISSGALKKEVGSENPLFENLPEPVGAVADENPELPPVEDPSNLTDSLARKMVEEMATLDPSEGGTIEMGADKISQNVFSFTGEIANKGMEQDLASFQKDVERIAGDYKTKKDATTDDILAYQNKVSSIFKENFSRFSSLDLSGEDASSPLVNSLELAIDVSLVKTKGMEVPVVFLEFHKSFLEFLAYQQKALELVRNDADPLRSSLVLQFKERDYDLVATSFQNEYLKLQNNPLALGADRNGFLESFASIFSVKKSHAFLFGMITFSPKEFWLDVKQWAKEMLTETLKKKLVDQMVKQTINWIQGKGRPKFVQDFKGFVLDEADKAIGSEIYQHYPQLCSSISPLVRSAFSEIAIGGVNKTNFRTERTRCTLSEVIGNVEEFYANFGTGGWNSYLEAIKPQNNAFGSIMILSDIASLAKSEEKEAATTKIQSSGGNLGTRRCTWANTHDIDQESQSDSRLAAAIDNAVESGEDIIRVSVDYILNKYGETPVNAKGEEINRGDITTRIFSGCPQGEWEITTPGTLVGDVLAKSAGSHLDYIISSKSLKALAAALVDSLTTKIIKAGVDGLTSDTVAKKSPKQTLEELKKSCEAFDSTKPEYQDCLNDAAAIAKEYESIRISSSTLAETASIYMAMLDETIANDERFLALRPIFTELVFFELSNCTSTAADFGDQQLAYMQYVTDANSLIITTIKEIQTASSSKAWLLEYYNRAIEATTPDEVDILTQELDDKFDPEQMSYLVQGSIDRFTELFNRYKGALKQVGNAFCPLPPPPWTPYSGN